MPSIAVDMASNAYAEGSHSLQKVDLRLSLRTLRNEELARYF